MSAEQVTVFATATVANVASGFDVLGFALDTPGDAVTVARVPGRAVRVVSITGDGGKLPTDPKKNTAAVAVQGLLSRLDFPFGVEISLDKKMPLSSGLGSSAASAVAAVYGANILAGSPFSSRDLLHGAVARRHGLSHIISTDRGFDRIPGVVRVDPRDLRL